MEQHPHCPWAIREAAQVNQTVRQYLVELEQQNPELLPRILLIGYLYGITSERKLVEELRMHLAWRWFTGLGSIRRFRIIASTNRFRSMLVPNGAFR
jgi:transposase